MHIHQYSVVSWCQLVGLLAPHSPIRLLHLITDPSRGKWRFRSARSRHCLFIDTIQLRAVLLVDLGKTIWRSGWRVQFYRRRPAPNRGSAWDFAVSVVFDFLVLIAWEQNFVAACIQPKLLLWDETLILSNHSLQQDHHGIYKYAWLLCDVCAILRCTTKNIR